MLNECIQCNLCDTPDSFANATDVARVASNVREFHHETFTVWRCNHCGSLHSKEAIVPERYYARYYTHSHTLDYFTRCSYRNRMRLLERAGARPTHRILDYGCGQGVFISYLQQNGFSQVGGYDPYGTTWRDPSVLDSQYDVLTLYDVIEHVDDPRAFVGQVVRSLAPGGLLVIGVPNASKITLSRPQTPQLHQPYHRHIPSEKALVNLGERLGFEVVRIHRRLFIDTLFPAVNSRFVWEYMHANGGVIDVLTEPPRVMSVLTSPKLMFYAVAGYFFPPRQDLLIAFRSGR